MRPLPWAALSAGVFLVATNAGAAPAPAPQPAPRTQPAPLPAARSAQSQGVETSARAAAPGHGYSADARRRADCLASYPGYDPKTDVIRRPGGDAVRCPF